MHPALMYILIPRGPEKRAAPVGILKCANCSSFDLIEENV